MNGIEGLTCEDRGFEKLNKFIYLNEHDDSHLQFSTAFCVSNVSNVILLLRCLQDLKKIISLFISLGQETEGECCNSVVTP